MESRRSGPALRPVAIHRDVHRLFLVALLAALIAVLAAPLPARADMAATGKAQVRLVDLSSGGQTSDFYVDGVRSWSGVAYKSVSTYVDVSSGSHVYEIRPAGAPAGSAPLARLQQTAEANSFYSVVTGGSGSSLKLNVFHDGSSGMPTPEFCEARFINASPDLKAIDFAVHGLDANFTKLGFLESSEYGQLPKGVYDVEMRDSQSLNVIAMVKNFVAPGGHMHTLAAAGGLGQPVELVEFYDAMTADQVPQGGAHTGMGGGAAAQSSTELALVPLLILGSALVLAGLPRFRNP